MNAFRVRVVEWAVTAVLWMVVLMIALGVSNLAEAIVDTVRYGHPR